MLIALAAIFAVFLAFGSAGALAAHTRKLINAFGGATSAVPDPAPLSSPQGVDIQQAGGDVYVADSANNRVEKFDALGNLLLGFGADVGGSGVNTCTLSCGAGTQGSAPGQFTTAKFVAVDNSGGASAGDIYVGDTGDNIVSKFNASGELIATWGASGQLNGSTTTAKSFGSLAGTAVDASGALYVLNTEKQLFKFTQGGAFVEEFQAGERGVQPLGLAVDASGNLFRANGDASIQKLSPSGGDVGTVTADAFVHPEASAFTIEPKTGDLYVATLEHALNHYAFNGSGEVVEPGGSTCSVVPFSGCPPSDSVAVPFAGSGIAVDSESGDVYLADSGAGEVDVYATVTIPDVTTAAASERGPTSATLNGSVNPQGIQLSDCHFEYGTSTAYGQSAPCVPDAASIPPDSSPHAVSARISGLQPGVTYHYRLVASNENGSNSGADESFETPPPPSIDSATVTELSPVSARLNAKINPNGADTRYRFEYGTSTAYGHPVPVPDEDIGEGRGDVSVSQTIEGLSAGTNTYHWRVIATNTNGTTTSPDHTFIYQNPGPNLPDNRAYEMVTPPKKNGALIGDVFIGPAPQIAADGSRVIASAIQCFADAQSCTPERGDGFGSPYAFTRTSSGWQATALAPPAAPFASQWGYSADGDTALFSMPTEPFGEDDFYAREADGTIAHIGPVTPPAAGPQGPVGGGPRAEEQALSADLSHIVWQSEGLWHLAESEAGVGLYEYTGTSNSQPLLVGVSEGQNSTDLVSKCGTTLGTSRRGNMSTDGRSVYFTAVPCASGSGINSTTPVPAYTLYARIDNELPDAHTVLISGRSPSECAGECASSVPGDAQFEGASADGSKAFFASTQRLTDSASEDSSDTAARGCSNTTGANGCNLYLYDSKNPAGHELIDVSAGDSSGNGPRFQGTVAISEDGSHVYFVAKGVLTSAPNSEGQRASDGANNLYVFERDVAHPAGRTAFIAGLPNSDRQEWIFFAGLPANVTPDGRYLVFTSHGDLTADDTSASGAQQIFRYDTQTEALIRVSVGDEGFNDNGNRPTPTPCIAAGLLCSEDAQIVPSVGIARTDPTMSDDGAYVFFESPVALTAGALDDVQIASNESGQPTYAQNVYEWHGGRVYLISDGRDVSTNAGESKNCLGKEDRNTNSAVCLLGADASGANVFFSTADQLTSQDVDTELDYYDARICTESDPCIKPPAAHVECQADACQGAPNLQPSPVPVATVSFAGVGNVGLFGTPVGRVKVLAHSVHGSTFILTVKVPGQGRISVSGAGLATLRHAVSSAGVYRFAVSLTPKVRASMRHHHRHRLRLRVRVGFTPVGGPSSSVSVFVTVRI